MLFMTFMVANRSATMNTCPTCHTTHPDTVRICPRDGTVLSPATDDPRVGTTLDGKYRLDTVLGRGGMGSIYRATHLMLDKPVAVKLINADLAPSPEMVRRFQREARAASNLNHPNIAAAFDLGQTTDGTLYIAMELVSGQSLKEAIRTGGPMASVRIVRILGQVASALAAAHANGIIHRDLKPQNIMLTQAAGGGEVAKLLDFGIAKTFDDNATQLTSTGLVLGTPQYMSPEQAAGRPIDGRSDLYSLGIILFEMLVGEVPFNDPSTPAVLVKHLTEPAPPPSKRRPDLAIPVAIESVALRCLEKEPGARYQTATEFATALEQAGVAYGAGASAVANEATVIVTPRTETPTQRTAPIATPTLRTDSTQPVPAAASAVPQAPSPPPPAGRQTTATVVPPVVPPPAVAPPAAAPRAAAATAVATVVSPPPPPSIAGGSAGGATPALAPASRSVAPGLAAIAGVLLLLLVAAYGLMAGWFGGVSGTDSSTPLQASAPSAPPPSTAAPNSPPGPSSPPSSPSAGSESAASLPSASGSSPASAAATPPAPAATASSSSRSGAAVAGSGRAAPPVRSAARRSRNRRRLRHRFNQEPQTRRSRSAVLVSRQSVRRCGAPSVRRFRRSRSSAAMIRSARTFS